MFGFMELGAPQQCSDNEPPLRRLTGCRNLVYVACCKSCAPPAAGGAYFARVVGNVHGSPTSLYRTVRSQAP